MILKSDSFDMLIVTYISKCGTVVNLCLGKVVQFLHSELAMDRQASGTSGKNAAFIL